MATASKRAVWPEASRSHSSLTRPAGSGEESETSRTFPSENVKRAKSSPGTRLRRMLRIAFLAFSSLLADAHAARGVDQEREGDRRALVPLESVEVHAGISDADDEVVLGQALDVFAVLVRDEHRQHDVLGPRALRVGGRVWLLGGDPHRDRGGEGQEHGGCEQALHRLIIRPQGPRTFPGGLCRLSSLDDARPFRGPREALESSQSRVGRPRRQELRPPEPLAGRARGGRRRGVGKARGRSGRRPRGDHAVRKPGRGSGRVHGRRDDVVAARARKDALARFVGAPGLPRFRGGARRRGRRGSRLRLRAGAERTHRGRARASLRLPPPADRPRVSDHEPVARRRGRPGRRHGVRARRRRLAGPAKRPKSSRPPPRSRRPSGTGTWRSRPSTSTTRGTATVRFETGGSSWSPVP